MKLDGREFLSQALGFFGDRLNRSNSNRGINLGNDRSDVCTYINKMSATEAGYKKRGKMIIGDTANGLGICSVEFDRITRSHGRATQGCSDNVLCDRHSRAPANVGSASNSSVTTKRSE